MCALWTELGVSLPGGPAGLPRPEVSGARRRRAAGSTGTDRSNRCGRSTVGTERRAGGRTRWLRLRPSSPAEGCLESAVMVADQRLPSVPVETGTIPCLCELLLGAQETKRKCQEHVNQTRYSVTITSLSGLPGPEHTRSTLRAGPTPAGGGGGGGSCRPGDQLAPVPQRPLSQCLGQSQG